MRSKHLQKIILSRQKRFQTSYYPSIIFRISQYVCLRHGRSFKTDRKCGQRGKQFSITMIRMKSLYSHTWQTLKKKKKIQHTKIKSAECPPGTGLSGAWYPRFPRRMRTFCCCLQLQHWFFFFLLFLLAKARYLRVFMCAMISVQVKGVEIFIYVSLSSNSLLYKREHYKTKLEWFHIPIYSTFHWLFSPFIQVRWPPVGSLDLTWTLHNTDNRPC